MDMQAYGMAMGMNMNVPMGMNTVYLCILAHLGLPMYRRTIFISAA
jgi:hypothetical protein